jgi:hypothetical protein
MEKHQGKPMIFKSDTKFIDKSAAQAEVPIS